MADEQNQNTDEQDDSNADGGQNAALTAEKEARNMGWVPKDDWTGDPEAWVDAGEFLERGKHVLPILSANNKKLLRRLEESSRKQQQLEGALRDSQEAIKALQRHYSENAKRQVEEARKDLLKQLAAAKEAGDVETEVELQDRLVDLREATRTAEAHQAGNTPPPADQAAGAIHPVMQAWLDENKDWFGVDKEKTDKAQELGNEIRAAGDTSIGAKFLAKLDLAIARWENTRGSPTQRGASKVDSGSSSGGRARAAGSKSYASLPQDAKDACMSDAKRLVGPNKAYKTLADWQTAYAKIYHGED